MQDDPMFSMLEIMFFCINVFTKVYNEHLYVHLDWGTGKQKKMSGQANADDIVWTQTLPCAFKRGNICGFFICTMNSQNYNSRMKNKLIKYFCHCIHTCTKHSIVIYRRVLLGFYILIHLLQNC